MDTALESMRFLPKQIRHALEEIEKIEFSDRVKNAQNIVIGAMGGSMFPFHVITSLFSQNLIVPVVSSNDYLLPSFVGDKTLFVGSSYSGTTEETLHTSQKALEKGASLTGVTTGGALGDFFSKHSIPFYHINPTYNPSGQPRIATGYMIFGMVMLLAKLGFIQITSGEVLEAVEGLERTDGAIFKKGDSFAQGLEESMIVYVAAEHLSGATHIVRNQTNENAKTFAEYNLIPELNHHFMEGLTYPKDKNVTFIFYNSPYYSERIQKRITLTKEVVEKQGVHVSEVKFDASSKLEEFLMFLQFGSYMTYALANRNNVDPSKIPWVDYFKEKLAS
jgi:glucose/mannose-6-phosphate isomerase